MNRLNLFSICCALVGAALLTPPTFGQHFECHLSPENEGGGNLMLGSPGGLLPTTTSSSANGYMHTPTGHIHALFIFLSLPGGDTVEIDGWPYGGMPAFAHTDAQGNSDILSRDLNQVGTRPNMSTYFREMSEGAFDFTGEAIPLRSGTGSSTLRDALADQYPNKDWSRFDLRTNQQGFTVNNDGSPPDSVLDYVFFVYRKEAFPGGDWSGHTVNNLTNSHGTFQIRSNFGGKLRQIMSESLPHFNIGVIHEFAHRIHTGPHIFGANMAVGSHFYGQNGWGMISAPTLLFQTANAWERWRLG